jgi:hypothetical protein
MFSKLFSSKSVGPTEPIFPVDNFSIFKLEVDDSLAIATMNTAYNSYPNKKFFPWSAQVLFEILDKNENGHPTEEEAEILNELEDKVEAFFKENHVVHSIGRLTRNGFRDVFYYLSKPNFSEIETKIFFDQISAIRPVNFYLDEDTKWDKVAEFIS